jgi:hypothetical protein
LDPFGWMKNYDIEVIQIRLFGHAIVMLHLDDLDLRWS